MSGIGDSILAVIPTLNEEAHVEACLRSIIGDDPEMARVRIIVVDGGSSDRTRAIVQGLAAEFPNVRLIDNPARLQSAAINRAVREEAGPGHRILVRCDAHSHYPPGFVLAVARTLVARDVASVVVPMDAVGTTGFGRAAAWIVDTPLGSGGAAHRGGLRSRFVDHGHHAGFALDWFRRIGGYDPGFSHNEDAEYDHRLALAGGRVWLDADIRVVYTMRPTFARLARQYYLYGRGRARTLVKHGVRPKLRQILPALVCILLLASLVLAPVAPVLLLLPAGYLALLVAAGIWMALRHRTPAGLLAGAALGAMHLCWGAGFLKQITEEAFRRHARSDPPRPDPSPDPAHLGAGLHVPPPADRRDAP